MNETVIYLTSYFHYLSDIEIKSPTPQMPEVSVLPRCWGLWRKQRREIRKMRKGTIAGIIATVGLFGLSAFVSKKLQEKPMLAGVEERLRGTKLDFQTFGERNTL